MSTPGATELLIVLVIVLLILGPKRLPSLGRQLGGGIREFRRSLGGRDEGPARRAAEGGHRQDASVEATSLSSPDLHDAAAGAAGSHSVDAAAGAAAGSRVHEATDEPAPAVAPTTGDDATGELDSEHRSV